MAKKKKAAPEVVEKVKAEEAKVEEPKLASYIAANRFVTFYHQPEVKDPKGLIGPYQVVLAEEVNDEWLAYHLNEREGETLYSRKEHFSKM